MPLTSFSEHDTIEGRKVPVWFAAGDDRPLRAFAGPLMVAEGVAQGAFT